MKEFTQINWHAIPAEEATGLLESGPASGLTQAEAETRLRRFGPNQMTAQKRLSEWMRFLLQFHQPLIYILLGSVVVSGFFGEWVDASVIFGVVFLNAIIGYIQEAKAEEAIGALAKMVVTEATVRRGGEKLRVPSAQLVPGDVVLLQSGDRVPADLRLLRQRSLRIEEAALTGESLPGREAARAAGPDTILADRTNLAFVGTLVTYGQAEGVVCATGDRTEMGRIAGLIGGAEELQTPLTRKIADFSRLLLYAIAALAVADFRRRHRSRRAVARDVHGRHRASGRRDPRGAARRGDDHAGDRRGAHGPASRYHPQAASRRDARQHHCHLLGQDRHAHAERDDRAGNIRGRTALPVTGGGYEPEGEILSSRSRSWSGKMSRSSNASAQACCATIRASSAKTRDGYAVQGDPTEAALIVAAQKAGLSETSRSRRMPRVEAIPFEAEYKYMATLHGEEEQPKVIYVKGAVETLAEKCDDLLTESGEIEPLDKARVLRQADEMAARGLRVLAFARREMPPTHRGLDHEHVAGGLTFLGLQGKLDPPRPEAIRAVAKCRSAGIRVKMITGDHVLTARAIAAQIGLESSAEVVALSGRELERLSDPDLSYAAERATVFARVAPEQKLRLVRALQARGHVVAMTGDGVNDAPALKQADIGVAMGITGTDVAKEAADMILTDDNFASIEAAVEEGRGVFDNLTKFIVWILPTNAGLGLVLLAAIIAGVALPLLPTQLLWINMVTAVLLGLTLVFETKESDLMQRPPRDPKKPLLTFPLLMRTGLVTLISLAGAFGLFAWEHGTEGRNLDEARAAVVNVIVMMQTAYLLSCRSRTRSALSASLFSNRWMLAGIVATWLAQILFTYVPFMNRLFHSAPVRAEAWLYIVAIGIFTFTVVEFEKWLRFRARRALQPSRI